MNILTTEYSLKHEALEVYVSGCNGPHCPGCHNSESWDFSVGRPWMQCIMDIDTKLVLNRGLIGSIWILGGEPLDQDTQELAHMLKCLKGHNIPIWLFTRYELEDVPPEIKQYCTYIKTGRYDCKLLKENHIQCGIELASSNQRVHRIN